MGTYAEWLQREQDYIWYTLWCDSCGGYLADGASFPRPDAENMASRHGEFHGHYVQVCREWD